MNQAGCRILIPIILHFLLIPTSAKTRIYRALVVFRSVMSPIDRPRCRANDQILPLR
ncbi:hypothetical protein GcM1_c12902o44 [Golovinomyces cichoracearum]|uniref:Uncharacterized protein n=1 Tax=Golovinomyces cichoracearum TaxID=62708 RepID=A0A420IDG4_9PEZI|nr:hypothetical protein GcM1_c12902o44 [Golovinomyces cichoracearum]